MAQKVDTFVQQNLRWNFSVNVMDNMLFVLALNFVSRETVMPLLVSHLTDSKILIGFIRGFDIIWAKTYGNFLPF